MKELLKTFANTTNTTEKMRLFQIIVPLYSSSSYEEKTLIHSTLLALTGISWPLPRSKSESLKRYNQIRKQIRRTCKRMGLWSLFPKTDHVRNKICYHRTLLENLQNQLNFIC